MELARAGARLAAVPVVAALFLVIVVAAVLGDDPPAVANCLPSGAAPAIGVPYEAEVLDVAGEAGVDPRLVAAVARVESGFDPAAVSPAGAVGIMQVMPATFAAYSAGDPTDPRENLRVGALVLASYFRAFGSWELALAAYNAGPGAVQAVGGIPPYPETQAYVVAVLLAWGEVAGGGATDPAADPPPPCTPPPAVGRYGLVVERTAIADPAWLTGLHRDYPAVDVAVPAGTLAYAVVEGTVVAATPDDGGRCGGTVLIDGADGARYVYCHLAGVVVAVGQTVTPGGAVGLTGGVPGTPGAGSSSGAHLHFGIEVGGIKVCPQSFLAALYGGQVPPAPAELPIGGCVG